MRFLIAFVALVGYASCSVISPVVVGATPGDVQAAVIDANVAVQDHVRAVGEVQARAAEAIVQHNTDAVRQVAEANRDLHQSAYWGSVAASQNLVAAAQTQAAAVDNALAARAAIVAPYAAPLGIAPLGLAAPLGVAPYTAAYGLGYRAW